VAAHVTHRVEPRVVAPVMLVVAPVMDKGNCAAAFLLPSTLFSASQLHQPKPCPNSSVREPARQSCLD